MVVMVPKLLSMQNCLKFWWVSLCLYIIVLFVVELLSAFIGPDHSLETASNSMTCLQVEINSVTLISLSGLPVLILKIKICLPR